MESYAYPDRHTDLLRRCQHGDRRAQRDLYGQYAKAMYHVGLRIVGSIPEAEDVLQEAFVDAFSRLDSFRGQSTFGAWLKQIVINRALGHLRSRKTLHSLDALPDDGDWDADEQTDEEATPLNVERIRSALQHLPDGYRVVLSLYLFEGYDHEEIGQVLNISETTSRSQFLRGKKKLLNQLRTQQIP